ncbi:MAG TPA: diaminopropionate ammonia-lyase [Pseudomonadales bacterium]|nr:diaminopropionate ammonia-lyase [Pseudomonadales bacterium]
MYLFNTLPERGRALAPGDAALLGPEGTDAVEGLMGVRAHHGATPLHALPGLAAALGVGALHVKDEGRRLGLGSFKALGGAYALMRLVQAEASRRLDREVPPEALLSPAVREIAADMTFACATDGNHGRSVAQGAQAMGATAVIFVHAGVSESRIDAIAAFGARIVRTEGTYDDSVAEASRVADEAGWTLLSDTSWPGYEAVPGLVMQGYTLLVREALQALPEPPTHVFLQAGVGGFAAAVAGHLALVLGDRRPHVTVVEPERAACLQASARQGRPVRVEGGGPTVMAMLECHEASLVAFRVLGRVADGFMVVDEASAPEAMRMLAEPHAGDLPIVAGESGGAGLAGLLRVLRAPVLAAEIALDAEARVLVVNTEGATDPALYRRLVGRSPEAVLEGEH